MQLNVTIDASEAEAVLNTLASAALRNRLLRATGGIADRQVKRRFQAKVSPDGAAWAPWSAGYASRKGQRGRGLLQQTGRMFGSLKPIYSGDSVIIGTNVHYAKYHQFGTTRMPARPFLGFGAQDIAQIEATLLSFLKAIVE